MPRKYIITGGAGLIGSNVINELNRMGEQDILIVDHLGSSEKWKNLLGLRFKDYLEKDKFLNMILEGSLNGYTHIIHLGACSSTTESNASYLIENNYHYTQILAHYAISNSIRFVYASSAATYGLGENGYEESNLESLAPLNMYGYSKHLFDLYAHKNKLLDRITGLKYFNVYGPGEFHKGDMRSLVLKGYEQIKSVGKLTLFKSYKTEFKDGEQKRDFLYVKDAAKITIHLLHSGFFGLFNVGRGIAESWMDLGRALFNAMKVKENIEFIDMPDSLKSKYQYYTKADTSRLILTNYLGGFLGLEESIRDYVSFIEK
ncbi:MAG: ADP-glyceromanno-heptose 6-epimerase [Spirochaetia bacterium]|nr:ADP-glyceromanno-heptose 6-epimerase [Spirochaetia bacterium]